MKKFYLKILSVIIGIISLILVYTITCNYVGVYLNDGGRLLTKFKRDSLRKGAFLDSDKTTVGDVIVLGDSEILSGFVPQVFNALSEYKLNSINLSLPGQPLSSAYYMLKEHLRISRKKTIAVVINFNVNYKKINNYGTEGASFDEAFGLLYYKKNTKYFVNFIIPPRHYIPKILKYLKLFLFNRQELNKLKNKNNQILNEMLDSNGYFPLNLDLYPNSVLPETIVEQTDNPNHVQKFPNVKEDIFFLNLLN